MKHREIVFVWACLVLVSIGFSKTENFPVLKGPYLGQKPPGKTPEIFASGIISTDKRELNAVFSPEGDEFYYAVYTPEPVNKCTIMVSRQVKGFWTKPETASFSGKFIDVDMAFSPEGNRLYFCSIRPDQPGSTPGTKHDIWFCSRKKDNHWSEPVKLSPLINSSESETYPTFTRKRRMYFAAIRKEGMGGKDIYYSEQIKGKFLKPVNIGNAVNTRYDEGDTFVAPDESYLVISSRGRPDSIGGSDFYVSFKRKDDQWSTPKNMGKPINTEIYEYCPMVSPDGKYFFFSRFSEGKSDIYWVDARVIEEMK
ncbi:MAG: PD40 domain-containing protein [Candidatus Aminicenantes bacterium]|nr:PD40 domain-containing protein [Candidatus Aminicenantes bacterium]